jgi:hypothetical protein
LIVEQADLDSLQDPLYSRLNLSPAPRCVSPKDR